MECGGRNDFHMQLPVESLKTRRGGGGGGGAGRLHDLLRDLKVSNIEVGCVSEFVDEVRGIPRGRGGGGGGGLCEEASYEEYNGLRQTRKGHKKLWDNMDRIYCKGVCVSVEFCTACVCNCSFSGSASQRSKVLEDVLE